LKISIEPVDEKPFYLTGDSPHFNVVIENQTSKIREGRVVVWWRLAKVLTIRPVKFKLNPLENQKYELPREWLYREGTAIYELKVMPKPPDYYAELSDDETIYLSLQDRLGVHPLCSYYVRDKDLYKYEEGYRNAIKKFSLITIGLTVLNVFLTIIRTLLFN
jgi:hypothetical protein